MREAAFESFEHVKQCAKTAYPRGSPCGISSRAARASPVDPGNSILVIVHLPLPQSRGDLPHAG